MIQTQRADYRAASPQADELLRDIPRRVRLPSNVTPSEALRSVVCILMQHANGPEAHYVFEALPKAIRPPLERCAEHRDVRPTRFGRDEMIRRVAEHLSVSRGDAEDTSAAVLLAIGLRVRREELHDVANHLPLELRDLWAVRRSAEPTDPHPIFEEIEVTLDLPHMVAGVRAFAAVMSTLSPLLARGEAIDLVEQLPLELRPLVSDALRDREDAPELLDREQFFARIATQLDGLDLEEVEQVVRAVFHAVQEYLRDDVFEHVMTQLPRDIEELWVDVTATVSPSLPPGYDLGA